MWLIEDLEGANPAVQGREEVKLYPRKEEELMMSSGPLGREEVLSVVDGRPVWRVFDLPPVRRGGKVRVLRAGTEFSAVADDGPKVERRWVFVEAFEAVGGLRVRGRAVCVVDGESVAPVSDRIRPSQIRVVHRDRVAV